MVCSIDGCEVTFWAGHTVEDAVKAGWRHFKDGKKPQLGVGIAICPSHTARQGDFTAPLKTKGRRQ